MFWLIFIFGKACASLNGTFKNDKHVTATPFTAKSSYADMYTAQSIRDARPNMHFTDAYKRSHIELGNGAAPYPTPTTTNKEMYKQWSTSHTSLNKVSRRDEIGVGNLHTNYGDCIDKPFTSQTKLDYAPPPPRTDPLPHRHPIQQPYIPNKAIFDDNTTSKSMYKAWTDVQWPQSAAPKQEYTIPQAKFDGTTNYNSTYVQHQCMPTQPIDV